MAARHSQATLVRFTRSTRSQIAVSKPPAGLRPPLPAAALLTSTLSPPSRSAAVSTSPWQAASSARSAATNVALPPASLIARTTAVPRATSRPWTQTRAPSRAQSRAVCSPIPEVEPVTRIRSPASRIARGSEPVGGLQLRILGRQHLRQVDHHLALLPGRVVLHLAVDHVDTAAVGNGLQHLPGEQHLVHRRAEDLLGDRDLVRMQRPGAHAPEQEGGATLVLAAERIPDVAERAIEGQGAGRRARVHHAGDGIVPRVLLRGRAGGVRMRLVRVAAHQIRRVPATDARRLHAARGGEVGWAEAHALDTRAGGADLLDVGHALRRLEDG